MMLYTMGFAFRHGQWLGVLKKKGPPVLHGKWNGIGGKIERGETPLGCMLREFEEEVGFRLEWEARGFFTVDDAKVYVFRADINHRCKIPDENDVGELLGWLDPRFAGEDSVEIAYNLHWLVPLVQAKHVEYFTIQERREKKHDDR